MPHFGKGPSGARAQGLSGAGTVPLLWGGAGSRGHRCDQMRIRRAGSGALVSNPATLRARGALVRVAQFAWYHLQGGVDSLGVRRWRVTGWAWP